MKAFRLLIATMGLLLVTGSANAANWTTTEGGSVTTDICTSVRADGVCWVQTLTEDSAYIFVGQCSSWTITVYGTATSVMPQTCTDSACATAENLLTTGLTGGGSLVFASSVVPMDFIKLVTGDNVLVSLKCGR